jgi:hypothetical protein
MTPMVLIGMLLLISGVGKLIAGEMAGETDFMDKLIPFWGTVAGPINFLLPWGEVFLGAALVFRIWPRFVATLCLPLYAGFMTSNIYAISHGVTEFSECGCFGAFAKVMGSPTPVQSLGIDIGMVIFGIAIIAFFPSRYFEFKPWNWLLFLKGGKKVGADEKIIA